MRRAAHTRARARALAHSEAVPRAALCELQLASAELDDAAVSVLARGLGAGAATVRLRALVLRDNECGDGGARQLAAAVRQLSTLTALVLHDNMIGDAGAAALADAARDGAALRRLDLGVNELSVSGVRSLANALASDACALRELCLEANEFGAAGARVLAGALRTNSVLEQLSLHANDLRNAGASAIGEALRDNGALRALDLCSNGARPRSYAQRPLRLTRACPQESARKERRPLLVGCGTTARCACSTCRPTRLATRA